MFISVLIIFSVSGIYNLYKNLNSDMTHSLCDDIDDPSFDFRSSI